MAITARPAAPRVVREDRMEGGVEGQRALEIGLCGRPVTEMRGDHAAW